ncbi:DUF3885 domain-containing protein [Streptomyces sp. NBC_00425]
MGPEKSFTANHPYDGGGDVFAPSAAVRDDLKAAHPDWLSTHPSGM